MVQRHTNKIDLKAKYKVDFEKVRALVNQFDPCGLIAAGVPSDEYDGLTNQLLSAVYIGKSKNELKALILHEIEHHFETPDLETLDELHKNNFDNDIDKLIEKLVQHFNV